MLTRVVRILREDSKVFRVFSSNLIDWVRYNIRYEYFLPKVLEFFYFSHYYKILRKEKSSFLTVMHNIWHIFRKFLLVCKKRYSMSYSILKINLLCFILPQSWFNGQPGVKIWEKSEDYYYYYYTKKTKKVSEKCTTVTKGLI